MTLWQTFMKQEGQWIEHGVPTTKVMAESVVAQLWLPILAHRKNPKLAKPRYTEPHCVPI